jgi:hypothetical protein
VVTEREQVERTLHDIAATVRTGDVEQLLRYAHSSAESVRQQARADFGVDFRKRLGIPGGFRGRTLRITGRRLQTIPLQPPRRPPLPWIRWFVAAVDRATSKIHGRGSSGNRESPDTDHFIATTDLVSVGR